MNFEGTGRHFLHDIFTMVIIPWSYLSWNLRPQQSLGVRNDKRRWSVAAERLRVGSGEAPIQAWAAEIPSTDGAPPLHPHCLTTGTRARAPAPHLERKQKSPDLAVRA